MIVKGNELEAYRLSLIKYKQMTNKVNLLISKLRSKKEEEVLFTIKQLRNSGNSLILPHLFDVLTETKSDNIRKEAVKLLNDLKDENSKLEIIKALKNEKYASLHKDILSSCWQSSLDYSSDLAVFVDLFKKSDFEMAFEAFTVIDNFEHKAQLPDLEQHITNLKNDISRFKDTDKEQLYVELVHILKSHK